VRINFKSLFPLMLLAIAAASDVNAAEQKLDPANVVRGLGDSIPAGAKNISLSPQFKVYAFEKSGLKFVQINSPKDEVLTVLIVTPGAQSRLPIGRAAEEPFAIVNDEQSRPLGMVSAAATCPCSAQVVYEDAYTRIVVISGANGEYIQTVVINKVKTPSTPPTG